MENQIRVYIEGMIRVLLTPLVLWLAGQGYLSENQALQFSAIFVSLVVTIVWSLVNKYFLIQKIEEKEVQVQTALDMPKGTTMTELKKKIGNLEAKLDGQP